MSGRAQARARASLALVKYWGKRPGATNLADTTSVALTLAGLTTTTDCRVGAPGAADTLCIDGAAVDPGAARPLFDAIRTELGACSFHATSRNDFPTAAGLASSSSGYAALAGACYAAARSSTGYRWSGTDAQRLLPRLSELARLGSGSACRSVYGGFVRWPAGEPRAEPLFAPDHWPELRVLVAVVDPHGKVIGSRAAMQRTRNGSPYYRAWQETSQHDADRAVATIAERDLQALGPIVRAGYLKMFATMFSATPPIVYWRPNSVALINTAEALRADGVPVWETMDAGPQVKLLTTDEYLPRVRTAVEPFADRLIEAVPGGGIEIEVA